MHLLQFSETAGFAHIMLFLPQLVSKQKRFPASRTSFLTLGLQGRRGLNSREATYWKLVKVPQSKGKPYSLEIMDQSLKSLCS